MPKGVPLNPIGVNQFSTLEWANKAYPAPVIVCSHPKQCGCAWGWAPSISTVPGMPFVLKYPYRNCTEGHNHEYK